MTMILMKYHEYHLIKWSAVVWIEISWFDNRLIWNQTEFETESISISGKRIWTPNLRDASLTDKGPVLSNH